MVNSQKNYEQLGKDRTDRDLPLNGMDGHHLLLKRIIAIVSVVLVLGVLGYAAYRTYFGLVGPRTLSDEEKTRVLKSLSQTPPAGPPLSEKEKARVLKSLSQTPPTGTPLSEEEKQKILESLKSTP